MHILIIPSWYPKDPTDVKGSFFREQALALKNAGLEVGILSLRMYAIREFSIWCKQDKQFSIEDDDGLTTYRKGVLNKFPRMPIRQIEQYTMAALQLFEQYAERQGLPDLIHAHAIFNAGFVAQEIQRRYGIPFVITEHSSAFGRDLLNQRQLKKASQCVLSADVCFSVSRSFSHFLAEKLVCSEQKVKWLVMPNIVKQSFLDAPLRSQSTEQFVFISVCFLTRNKRIDLLIQAFTRAFKGQRHVRLHIGGSGEEESALRHLSKELGMTEQIIFLGALSRERVLSEMSQAHVCVSSSDVETFGVVLIEAMALGKPVIATRSGGPEDFVCAETGLLVEAGNLGELSQALVHLYQNYHHYDPLAVRAYCKTHFSEKAVSKRLTSCYKQILDCKQL